MMLNEKTKSVQRKYDRFSRYYDSFEEIMENNKFGNWRKNLIGNLKGKILEIGVGTGKNLSYYNKEARVTGIDLSSKMLEKAKFKLKELNNPNITLMQMDAQNLEFKDNSFDYVICTFVLCSVPDPVRVLKEMRRVCKNKGKILMIEHMLSDNKFIAFFEHLHNPISKAIMGVNINRKTVDNVKKSGIKIDKVTNLSFYDVFRKI